MINFGEKMRLFINLPPENDHLAIESRTEVIIQCLSVRNKHLSNEVQFDIVR